MIIHILVHIIQLVGILVPLVGCVSLVKKLQSRASMYLLLANLGGLIINGSYMLLLQTKTYEGALIALKMEYFGNVVFYLMFGMFLWSYLRLKRHTWVRGLFAVWYSLDAVLLLSIWITNGFPLVFRKLQFQWNEALGLVLIESAPGIVYILRYCIVCFLLFCGMIYTIVRMFLVRVAAERNNLAKLAGAQLVICVSLVCMLLFNFSFDVVPICASLSILSIIISVHRDEFFGVMEIGREWVFEQMGDAFVIVDELYGYLDSNAYAKKVFSELKSMRKNKTVTGKLYELFIDLDKIQQIDGKYYHKKIMEVREKGVLSGYCLLLVDITEQYVLMERVKEEKERADAANQAKSAFVSNVSHEIRTPMNAIVGMTQIMLRRDLPEQDRQYLMNIRNSGNALLAIVNDLLDMSKIEAGKMELVNEAYDFMSMLSDLGMIVLNRIGGKPVELLYDIDTEIPARLYGDALRIRQIIINLMNNATKFTEEGYVCLTVKVNKREQDDLELFVSVRDTGQGIKEEDLGKLFGTFQQVDTGRNHHKEGTGLGLSISRQLVELMHGNIGVKSKYGEGSEFYFTIHQQIVDGSKAAWIGEGREAVILGRMKNETANQLLKVLAGSYGLCFQEDVTAVVHNDLPVFCFTDQYDSLSHEEKQRLAELGAVVCGMQNPMAESDFPEGMLTMNKPLYSYNFCNVVEGRQPQDKAGAGDKNSQAAAGGSKDAQAGAAAGSSKDAQAGAAAGSSKDAQSGAMALSSKDTWAGAAADGSKGTEVGNKAIQTRAEGKAEPGVSGKEDKPDDPMDFRVPEACVLIVDDNEINCMVAEEMLKPLEMKIEIAVDGRQALEMVRKKEYDMIFMDHFMPVMNGIEAAKEIRKLEGGYYKKVPMIALTANTAREQQEEYLQAGMSDFLSKPIDMSELYQMVRKWIPEKIRQ